MLGTDINIRFTENGYIVFQRQSGVDHTKEWAAETESSLLNVISVLVKEYWKEKYKEMKEKTL